MSDSLARRNSGPSGGIDGLSAVDRLLVLLLEGGGGYFTRMLAFGFTEEETCEGWDEARRAGYAEATVQTD